LLAAWPDHFREHACRSICGMQKFASAESSACPNSQIHRKYQFMYLNGRAIRDRFISTQSRKPIAA